MGCVDAIGMVTRERLVSTALGGSAVGLFGLSVLGFLDRIEMGRVAAGLLAVGAVVAAIATLRSERVGSPRETKSVAVARRDESSRLP